MRKRDYAVHEAHANSRLAHPARMVGDSRRRGAALTADGGGRGACRARVRKTWRACCAVIRARRVNSPKINSSRPIVTFATPAS